MELFCAEIMFVRFIRSKIGHVFASRMKQIKLDYIAYYDLRVKCETCRENRVVSVEMGKRSGLYTSDAPGQVSRTSC